jgi:uncharacterized protein (DUF2141 family)
MKKIIILITSLILISNCALSQFSLTIEISGIKNSTGKIMLQLFDENEKVIKQEAGEIKEKTSLFSIQVPNPGKYAVRYFHDENLNGNLDTNLIGIPKEGYGFSNNATGKFGPPPFEKWLFEITEDKKISLKPTY